MPVNVEVKLSEVRGDQTRLIKKFIKKVKKERIIEDYLDRKTYTKPSKRRRIKKAKRLQVLKKLQRERDDNCFMGVRRK